MGFRYFNLEDAAVELRLRQQNGIAGKARALLGTDWDNCPFPNGEYGFLARSVSTGRIEDWLFAQRAAQVGLTPVWAEYPGDKFTTTSPDKARLAKMLIDLGEGRNGGHRTEVVRVISHPARWEGRTITEVRTDQGEPLVAFHHRLREAVFGTGVRSPIDLTAWLKSIGRAEQYYRVYFAMAATRGVLFENFDADGLPSLADFNSRVVHPAYEWVKENLGAEPLIVFHPKWTTRLEAEYVLEYYHGAVLGALR